MIFDLQKASLLKRFSAYLLDLILLVILIVGFAGLLSTILNYDRCSDELDAHYARYESEYGITFELSVEEFDAMREEDHALYETAYNALISDQAAMHTYNLLINLTLLITTFSILLGYLVLEFIVPLLFGNGQTLGKKVFGIALMRTGGIRINTISLFIRTILGKYTIETMIPVLVILITYFNGIGIIGPFILLAIPLSQFILLASTRRNAVIHDLLADTVAVDMASQMIFDSEADLIAYKEKVHAQKVARQRD